MTSELRRKTEQIKSRLSRHLSASESTALNIPPVVSLTDIIKTGKLLKLCSRGTLYRDCWKRRLCVLTKTRLYIYKTEGRSGEEKAVGEIDLSISTRCQEAVQKSTRTPAHCFVISSPAADHRNSTQHVLAAPTAAEMTDWLAKVRSAVRSASRQRRSGAPVAQEPARPSSWCEPAVGTAPSRGRSQPPQPLQPAQAIQLSRPRGRGPARRRPEASSQPSLLLADQPTARLPAGQTSCPGSAYEYSSSEESLSSASSSRCSVVRRLNTTMPELRPDRRSPSPVAPVSATSASDISRQMAGTDASTASTALRASPPTLAERERPSLFSPVKPLAQTEGESVDIGSSGGASTSGSSLSNLTSTLTREGQTLPAVAASLHELTAGLRGLSDRVATLADGLESSHAELAVTRADVAAVQGSVTSLQTLAASLNNRMVAFSGMFRKVDEQLLDMWSEMDTVNNNVHHVMHKALEYQEQNERMSAQLEEMRAELLAAFPERLLGMPRSATTRTPPRSQARSRSRRDRHDSEQLCEIDDLVVEPATEPPGDGAQVTPCDDTSQ